MLITKILFAVFAVITYSYVSLAICDIFNKKLPNGIFKALLKMDFVVLLLLLLAFNLNI